MASSYYDSTGKSVVNGDTAVASDLNDINSAVDAGFQLAEADIGTAAIESAAWADKAESWAEEPYGVEVEVGKYSALHHETNAATSASNASSSASSASTSASSALASKNAAATSETNAASSATAAATSETNAASSATAAATSETNAASSASSANTSATNAASSASAAATSANNASTSASSALASKNAAATSETNAASSASSASTSATNAATSETNAASSATAAAISESNAEDAAAAAASTSASLAEDTSTTTGLTWGWLIGQVRSDNVITDVAAGTLLLTDNATNYVEYSVAGGMTVNQTGFTSGAIPIRTVVTSVGVQTSSVDKRAWLNVSRPINVDSVAALRLTAPGTGPVQPLGYYAPGDGGGGPLRVTKTAPVGGLVDNGGSILAYNGAVGTVIAEGELYWGWEWSGAVNIRWFGTKGDGITDDGSKINAAIAYAGANTSLFFPAPSQHYYTLEKIAFNPTGKYIGEDFDGRDTPATSIKSGYTGVDEAFSIDAGDAGVVGYSPVFKTLNLWRETISGPSTYLRQIKHGYFEKVSFIGGTSSLLMDSGANFTGYNLFSHCKFKSGVSVAGAELTWINIGLDIKVTGTAGVNENWFVGCLFEDNTVNASLTATSAATSSHQVFSNCAFARATDLGVDIDSSFTNVTFTDSRNEQNLIRTYAAGGRNIRNAGVSTKILNGNYASNVLGTAELLEDLSGDMSIIGDLNFSGYENVFSKPVQVRTSFTVNSADGTSDFTTDYFSPNWRVRVGGVNKMVFNTTDDRWKILSSSVGKIMLDGTTTNQGIFHGSGSPEGVVAARVGSIYTRSDGGAGTSFYVKESGTGNTGWIAK